MQEEVFESSMLWFNFILILNVILLCFEYDNEFLTKENIIKTYWFKLYKIEPQLIIHYHTRATLHWKETLKWTTLLI